MDSLRGTVSNCQHTLKVSGGGNNTSTTTTYIALFRVNGQPVEFRTRQPSSLSDGDQVAVAGSRWHGALNVYACRNLTTGETMNAGVWGYVFGAVLVPVIGLVLCAFLGASLGGTYLLGLVAVVGLLTAYLAYRAILIFRAERLVAV